MGGKRALRMRPLLGFPQERRGRGRVTSLGLGDVSPILWPPHENSLLTGKDPDAGRDWGREEKGTTEDEMAGWHH